jgi:hypothetical protein
MKAALLFLTIGLATLGCGVGYAQMTGDAKSHQESKSPVHQPGKAAGTKKPTHKSIPLPKPAVHPRTPNNTRSSASGNMAKAREKGLDRRNGPANVSQRQSSGVDRARPMRTPAASRPVSSTANNLHHRGANPPIVGGPRSTSIAGTATLSGNRISRRR